MIINKRDLHSIITKASIQNREAEDAIENKKFGDLVKRNGDKDLDILRITNALSDYKWLLEKEKQIEELRKFLESFDNESIIEIRMYCSTSKKYTNEVKND